MQECRLQDILGDLGIPCLTEQPAIELTAMAAVKPLERAIGGDAHL